MCTKPTYFESLECNLSIKPSNTSLGQFSGELFKILGLGALFQEFQVSRPGIPGSGGGRSWELQYVVQDIQ